MLVDPVFPYKRANFGVFLPGSFLPKETALLRELQVLPSPKNVKMPKSAQERQGLFCKLGLKIKGRK